MKKIKILKNSKYIILLIFTLLSVLSVLLIGTVKINYNISDYLDDSTETKISLGIMEDEFGLISNIQVMVNDVTPEEAEEIKTQLKNIKNVNFVNFNSQNTDYYKDGSALFVVLVDGNEYSESAKAVLGDIESALGENYGERLNLGGTVMEKKLLREAIQGEIIMILGISVCLVAVLMLLTASSWIEPLVLLAASGIAVLLNMGTNAIFGEISYITNAIAAILQLALSIDYSIVLLHSYRSIKEKDPASENERAMIKAIKEVIKPVSASALTTIAGLLALLFMSFTIGFDIGIVLMKSIVISAITSITLLPAFLLIFDKLMQKTAKKPLVIKGKFFCDVSIKAGKAIVPIALVIIIICCVLNLGNDYNFVDSCNKNENITDKFGESGTLIVLYENAEDNEEKEKILAELLASYKTEEGKEVLKSHVAYSNTIGQIYDVEKASKDLGLSMKDAELLFMIYRFTEDGSAVKMDIKTFISFAIDLIGNDEDAQGFVSPEFVKLLSLLPSFEEIAYEKHTAYELYSLISSLDMFEGVAIDESAIKQLYGNRFFDDVTNKRVAFGDMVNYIIESGYLDDETAESLMMLPKAKEMIDAFPPLPAPTEQIDVKKFAELIDQFDISLPDGISPALAWTSPTQLGGLGLSPTAKIPFSDLFSILLSQYRSELPEDMISAFERLGTDDYAEIYGIITTVNSAFESEYSHIDFLPALNNIVLKVTGETASLPSGAEADDMMKQLYIMYYIDDGRMPDGDMGLIELINYVVELAGTSKMIADRLPEGIVDMLSTLEEDALKLEAILNDTKKYDYLELTTLLDGFIANIQSTEINFTLPESVMMGVYVKYAVANELVETGSISATDLLSFVLDEAETNELLASSINSEMQKTIRESQENMISAQKLLSAENYSRMLLTVNLPAESEESSRFVEYLTRTVKDIFGEDAYVAGEIATTNDLIKAFDDDNRLISVFTVVSIFVIILVVFRSLSLPIILVAIIQGAIWIAMSMSLVSGPMFFMSYIMSMCILMGATIDYGILLSTNYVKYRETLDRRESLYKAVDAAIPTVFTSGLILMICGLVVGFIASQTSISSVGFLLCRGTLISTVMIILVLPSLLYLLDSFVMKLTLKKK